MKLNALEFELPVGVVIEDDTGRIIRHLGSGRFTTPLDALRSVEATILPHLPPFIRNPRHELSAAAAGGEFPFRYHVGVLVADAILDDPATRLLPRGSVSLLMYTHPDKPNVLLTEPEMRALAAASK